MSILGILLERLVKEVDVFLNRHSIIVCIKVCLNDGVLLGIL